MIVATVGLVTFLLGFVAGCGAYAITYAVFAKTLETEWKAKVIHAQNQAILARSKIEATKERLAAAYGTDLSERHKAILDEEVERALQATRARNGDAK